MAILDISYHSIALATQKGFVLPDGWTLQRKPREIQIFLDGLHAASVTEKHHSNRVKVTFGARDPDFQLFVKNLLKSMSAQTNPPTLPNDETEFEKALIAAFQNRS